jgi:hypothetical protein
MPTVKFNEFNVTNGEIKARVFYSIGNRIDGRACVTLYDKDYDRNLGKIFAKEYKNDSDSMTDYFEAGRVVLFEDSPYYEAALKIAKVILAKRGY